MVGGEVEDEYDLLSEPTIGMPGLAIVSAELAQRHGLCRSAELELLIDYIFGLSCRDQDQEVFELQQAPGRRDASKDRSARRSQGFKLAKAMRDDARLMLAALERIHKNMCAFDGVVGSNPALLESIFEVDCGPPDELSIPDEIGVLHTLFNDNDFERTALEELSGQAILASYDLCQKGFWEAVDARLARLAALPIRAKLSRGPMADKVLQTCLASAKSYWLSQGKSWSMSSLKHAVTRNQNGPNTLQGGCEQFVHDLLSTCSIQYSLRELANAWAWVDQNGA